MKQVMALIITSFMMLGCTIYIDRGLKPVAGPEWEINNLLATYKCENVEVFAGDIHTSTLTIIGPVIPVKTPGTRTLNITYIGMSYCPTVTLNDADLVLMDHLENSNQTKCSYQVEKKAIQKETKVTFKIQDSECIPPPLFYDKY